MKAPSSFSRKKFQSLPADNQRKAMTRMIASLDRLYDRPDLFSAQLEEISNCLSWLEHTPQGALADFAHSLSASGDRRNIILATQAFIGATDASLHDGQIPLLTGDGYRSADPIAQERAAGIVAILDNLRSAFNVGAVFRAAECLALGEIWLCGITARPGGRALEKTARDTTSHVKWRHFPTTPDALAEAKANNYTLYALETARDASSAFAEEWRFPLGLVIGNESLGIAPDVLSACDRIVALPVLGWKNSLNVASAFTVCAYQMVCGHPAGANPQGV